MRLVFIFYQNVSIFVGAVPVAPPLPPVIKASSGELRLRACENRANFLAARADLAPNLPSSARLGGRRVHATRTCTAVSSHMTRCSARWTRSGY